MNYNYGEPYVDGRRYPFSPRLRIAQREDFLGDTRSS